MNFTLKVWRQKNKESKGTIEAIEARDIPDEASFLEMLDIVNQQIIESGGNPIAFDSDCREGICGMCSLVINGIPHGPSPGVTTCQVRMRQFSDGGTIWIEPFRANAFPVLCDLVVDRTAFDKIIQAGGFVSARTGSAPEANSIPIPKQEADASFNAAACIGCGACVATCKNASAMLFVAAKNAHLGLLPQGQPERDRRVVGMVKAMDEAGFGNCTNQYECSAVCPAEIDASFITMLNRDFARAAAKDAVGAI